MNLFDLIWLVLFVAVGGFIGEWFFGATGMVVGAGIGLAALLLFTWVISQRWKTKSTNT